jgi:thiamine monophosphate synthase
MVEEQNQAPITAQDKHLLVHLPDGHMSIAERIPPMPKSHIICYSCRSMLEFVAGPQ